VIVSGIHHLALRVADLERARAFYADALGLALVRRLDDEEGRPRAVWLRSGKTLLMLERRLRGAGADSGSGHLIAFAVSGLAAWEKRLAARGVAVDERTRSTLYVHDPDGHRVGLSVRPPAGRGRAPRRARVRRGSRAPAPPPARGGA
jgi:catechol 2,3-dioxygenase-like lactoylglutathione lyase family enzyme